MAFVNNERFEKFEKKVWLSSPTMYPESMRYVMEAYETNWMSTVGANINEVEKAFFFFEEIDKGNYDCVVTYGSSHSNHCRVIANMAAEREIPCYIIGPRKRKSYLHRHEY